MLLLLVLLRASCTAVLPSLTHQLGLCYAPIQRCEQWSLRWSSGEHGALDSLLCMVDCFRVLMLLLLLMLQWATRASAVGCCMLPAADL